MNPFLFPWTMIPNFPTNNPKPPTIYSILESIVNFGTDNKQKIRDLAKYGRQTIFNFEYPLSVNVKKEDFECMILNHYMMRRINFDTVTAFNIMLNTKLNEIMPKYNKLFDSFEYINFYDLTEKIGENSETQEGTNKMTSETSTESENISDRRNSELPQNELSNVKDGKYVSNYDYDKNNIVSSDTNETNAKNTNDKQNNYKETVKHTPAEMIRLFAEYEQNMQNVYTLIFKELDCLFYGLE